MIAQSVEQRTESEVSQNAWHFGKRRKRALTEPLRVAKRAQARFSKPCRCFDSTPPQNKVESKKTNLYALIAQSVEQRTENPCVGGSIPP